MLLLAALSLAAVPAQESPQDPYKDPSPALNLTEAQKRTLRALEAESAAKAAAALLELPQLARSFNTNLLSAEPDPKLDRQLGREMADTFAKVIQLRLVRIRAAAKTFTPEQRQALAAELKKPDAPFLFDDLVRRVLGDPKQ
jgi:hypothetical protein